MIPDAPDVATVCQCLSMDGLRRQWRYGRPPSEITEWTTRTSPGDTKDDSRITLLATVCI